MARIRKGDMVEVIAGNDKGKRGRVLRIVNKKGRLVIQGVNLRWKHMRKSQQSPQGGRLRREVAIAMSNVMFFDEGAAVRSRIGYLAKDGKKVRILRRTGDEVGAAVVDKKKSKAEAKARKKAAPKDKKES